MPRAAGRGGGGVSTLKFLHLVPEAKPPLLRLLLDQWGRRSSPCICDETAGAERKPIQGRAREIAGVAFIFALAVFLFMSVSTPPGGPSLSNYETSRARSPTSAGSSAPMSPTC